MFIHLNLGSPTTRGRVKMGLKYNCWLLRKSIITVAHSKQVQCCCIKCREHSLSHFFMLPLIAFEPRFYYLNQLNTLDHLKFRLQRPKTFTRAILRRLGGYFQLSSWRQVATSHAAALLQCFSAFSANIETFHPSFDFLDKFWCNLTP
jgi:hypothetical protein